MKRMGRLNISSIKRFLRKTKNVYISIVPKDLVLRISSCEPISYDGMRKRLMRAKLSCRINELRDYFGTSWLDMD